MLFDWAASHVFFSSEKKNLLFQVNGVDISSATHHDAVHVLKNAGNDIHLVVVREREDLEKRTVTKTSKENLVTTEDSNAVDEALEEAFTKEEVIEVDKEPEEKELPQVRTVFQWSTSYL